MSRGFTLIELLTVVAIIAMVTAMSLGSTRLHYSEAAVKGEAERFAAFCAQVRARALAQQTPLGVAINIQNDPDGNGAVLNNRSGGHWYRAVGTSWSRNAGRQVLVGTPVQGVIHSWGGNWLSPDVVTFPELSSRLSRSWAGPKVTLAAGKVRFLALGDTDEGAHVFGSDQAGSYGYTSTYPRPYFGYFDAARKTLYAWGGYNPELHSSEPWPSFGNASRLAPNYTGFFYQGDWATPLANSRHPDTRAYDVDWNHDNAISADEKDQTVWSLAGPRPLVSGEWQDFIIIFLPDGRSFVPPFKTNRKRFKKGQFAWPVNTSNDESALANGVLDTTRAWQTTAGFANGWNDSGWGFRSSDSTTANLLEVAEVTHFDRHTGAIRITLAPDVQPGTSHFESAHEALASISPMYRVEISKEGGIRTFRVHTYRDDGYLAGRTVWPSAPGLLSFTGSTPTSASGDLLAANLRHGWLHRTTSQHGTVLTATTAAKPSDLVIRGQPIIDAVTPRMMTDKIWWVE